jgi:ketosteroid isomerase-like protein
MAANTPLLGLHWRNRWKRRIYRIYIDRRTRSKLPCDTPMKGPASKLFVNGCRQRTLALQLASVFLAALVACPLHARQPKEQRHENRHAIDQLEEDWRNAVLDGNTQEMSSLLADDYTAITAYGTLQTKDEALSNLNSGRVHFSSLEVSDRKVRFYGKTAVVTSRAEVQATTPEGALSGSYRYTRVYVQDQQGQWKIVSFEASRIRVPFERSSPQSP